MLRQHRNRIIVAVVSLLCVLSIGMIVSAAYINTNRDTRPAPAIAESALEIGWGYELIYETDLLEYYFRDDRDIIAVKNKETGYVFKTGIDSPFTEHVEEAHAAVYEEDYEGYTAEEIEEELQDVAEDIYEGMTVENLRELADGPVEGSMTETYIGIANSLISVEYFSGEGDQMTINRLASASLDEEDGTSSLVRANGSSSGLTNEWVLEVLMEKIDLGMKVYITFGDDGSIKYDIPYEEITGTGKSLLSTISITPYLGASGGSKLYWDEELEMYDDENEITNEIIPGYALVPDGSGGLIRFGYNSVEFTEYKGDVYGADPATNDTYDQTATDVVPVQDPSMPVFGISHGDGTQAAFVAYATSGDEYMSINAHSASLEQNVIKYTYVYPKFEYNMDYYQVTTQGGQTYRKTMDEQNKFDISMTYKFLYGDGSDGTPKADYTGMAQAYREHLIQTGELVEADFDYDSVPIRLDFFMADSKKGILLPTQVTMTTTDNVDSILTDVTGKGITNINSGLIGWQTSGETLSKPYNATYSGEIGSEGDFEDLITKYAGQNIDISLSRDFVTINKTMMGYYGNAAKHNNTQYLVQKNAAILPDNCPVTDFGYALPENTAEWILELNGDVAEFSNSLTMTGVSDTLISTHDSDGDQTTVTESIALFQNAVSTVAKDGTGVNLENPNKYLWAYTDRFLQAPVGTSQYVYETDTVPFLQMVLHGTMEVYAPYSNFSFYSQSDMLRMIDYNIYPSFILTQEPSYLLSATASAHLYSTEYDQYSELIESIYDTVNEPLSEVIGYDWTGRYLLADGIILNTYANGSSTKGIVINYTDTNYNYFGESVTAESAKVVDVEKYFEGGTN